MRARARARLPTAAPASGAQFTYDEPLRVESLTQSICDLKMSFGEGGDDDDEDGGDGGGGSRRKAKMSRPFGVSLLVAGCDARGPQLYCTDPSGTYVCWDAQAIGNGSEAARTILQERYAKTLSVDAAAVLIVRVLCETMEEKVRLRRGAARRRRAAAARATRITAARPNSARNPSPVVARRRRSRRPTSSWRRSRPSTATACTRARSSTPSSPRRRRRWPPRARGERAQGDGGVSRLPLSHSTHERNDDALSHTRSLWHTLQKTKKTRRRPRHTHASGAP